MKSAGCKTLLRFIQCPPRAAAHRRDKQTAARLPRPIARGSSSRARSLTTAVARQLLASGDQPKGQRSKKRDAPDVQHIHFMFSISWTMDGPNVMPIDVKGRS